MRVLQPDRRPPSNDASPARAVRSWPTTAGRLRDADALARAGHRRDRVDVYEFVDSRPHLISAGTGQRDIFDGNAIYPPAYTGLESFSADGDRTSTSRPTTRSTPQDHNGPFIKFYDARTNGGFPIPPPLQPCVAADECHGNGSATPAEPQVGTGAELGAGGNEQAAPSKKTRRAGAHRRGHVGRRSATGTGPHGNRHARSTGEPQWLIWPERNGRDGESSGSRWQQGGRTWSGRWLAALFLSALHVLLARPGSTGPTQGSTTSAPSQSDTQAGGHPDIEIHAKFDNRVIQNGEFVTPVPGGCGCDDPETIDIQFPTGFIGNPHAVPKCTLALFSQQACARESQVGVLDVGLFGGYTPIYNMEPHENEAGLLGFNIPIVLAPSFIVLHGRTDSDYGLNATNGGIYHLLPISEFNVCMWGVPSLPAHDKFRFPIAKTAVRPGRTTRIPATHRCRRTARRPRSWRTRQPAAPTSRRNLDHPLLRLPGRARRSAVAEDHRLRPAQLQPEPLRAADDDRGRLGLGRRRRPEGAADAEPDRPLAVGDPGARP